MRFLQTFPFVLAAASVACVSSSAHSPRDAVSVEIVRLPDGAVQPDVVVDEAGVVHIVYLAGEPSAANVFYAQSRDGGTTLSSPIRVNSEEGSAIATGTIRGAQIALGRNGRVHVAWNGSDRAREKGPPDPNSKRPGMPMLYARMDLATGKFEPQRNVITQTTNLDGGGSVAADNRGGVFVAWHGGDREGGGEESRRVWIARSRDDGETFAKEAAVSDPRSGVCGCCALRLFADRNANLHLLYRAVSRKTHRDVYSLFSRDRGQTFTGARVQGWEIGACPMTSMSIAEGEHVLGAWETDGQVYFAALDDTERVAAPAVTDTSESARRKHPRIAVNGSGIVLLTWTEGTSWARGGSVAWQAFAADGEPTAIKGLRPGVPVWSFAAVVARRDGRFTIVY
jgi:hypothetical protein